MPEGPDKPKKVAANEGVDPRKPVVRLINPVAKGRRFGEELKQVGYSLKGAISVIDRRAQPTRRGCQELALPLG